ncbi:MAG: TPM domain-containing protein [Clostridia bacterium]|nr:TPM domain-containing protein [Clostridia bacterium]
MKKWICGILSLVMMLTAATAFAARMPSSRGALTDDADVLSNDMSAAIVEYAEDVKDETGVQMQVVVVHFLDGLDAQTYASQLFKEWKLDDEAVLLLCAAGEDSFATAMGSKAESKLGKQNMDNLMYTSSDFANHIARQEYDVAFAKYFVAFNDLANKRYDEKLTLPKTITKTASVGVQEGEAITGPVGGVTGNGSLWNQIVSGVVDFENGESGVFIPGMWSQTMEGVQNNSNNYTTYQNDHDTGNGLGVGGWIILIILVMIIFSQSHPARKAKRNYRNYRNQQRQSGGKGWLFGLLGLAVLRMIRRK